MSVERETAADEIKRICEEKGLNVVKVVRRADAERTFFNWEKKDPESFVIKNRILDTIDVMAKEV